MIGGGGEPEYGSEEARAKRKPGKQDEKLEGASIRLVPRGFDVLPSR